MLRELIFEVIDGAEQLQHGQVRRQHSRVRQFVLALRRRDVLQVAENLLQVDAVLLLLQLVLFRFQDSDLKIAQVLLGKAKLKVSLSGLQFSNLASGLYEKGRA